MDVKFVTTTADKLQSLAVVNGQIIAISDQNKYFYDMGGARRPVSGVQEVAGLPSTGVSSILYIDSTNNYSAHVWDGSSFQEIGGSGIQIDDTTPTTYSVYSSSKTESLVENIIDDSASSTATAYSSAKTNELLSNLIDDTTASTASVYSSSKTETLISEIIDDSTSSTGTAYSSAKTNEQIAGLINDSTASTGSVYSSTKIDQLIQGVTSFDVQIVNELPDHDISTHTIYFLLKSGVTGDTYDEYMYIDNQWELIGTTAVTISIATTATAGIVKPDGTSITVAADGTIAAVGGSAGHVIQNDSGSTLSAEENLQFKGAYVEDDSTNDRTTVNIVREMNYADVASLTDAQKKGIIITERDQHPAGTPLIASNVGYQTTTVESALDNLSVIHTFNVATTDWIANTDTSTNARYPYIAEIASTYYNAQSRPIWEMYGVNAIPSDAEHDAIILIEYADFQASGVTLYATDQPGSALVLVAKGV